MKLENHKNNFVAQTFASDPKNSSKKVKKSKSKKAENNQLKLKKKESPEQIRQKNIQALIKLH